MPSPNLFQSHGAADGAVALIERLSPALEQVDSSSGGIGAAVNNALRELVAIIAAAPADPETRAAWLERLWDAHAADDIPYIELLADHWGELCASPEVASDWADRLLGITTVALSPDPGRRGYFHGTSACLSALSRAGRYRELIDLLATEKFWPYRRWAVDALAAIGSHQEAIALAESSRGTWTHDVDVDRSCERILLAEGRVDETYRRYGLTANRARTYAATFRAVAKKYPHVAPREVLADLVRTTPGEEGKWFAASKEAGFLDEALALASRSPCDPKTLTRAARDFADSDPEFALAAGLLALAGLVQGYGYEITGADVWAAYAGAMTAADRLGRSVRAKEQIAPSSWRANHRAGSWGVCWAPGRAVPDRGRLDHRDDSARDREARFSEESSEPGRRR